LNITLSLSFNSFRPLPPPAFVSRFDIRVIFEGFEFSSLSFQLHFFMIRDEEDEGFLARMPASSPLFFDYICHQDGQISLLS